MSGKIQINRLDKDELVYELTRRGIAIGNVEGMRRSLASAIHMEKQGHSFKYPKYSYTFEQDSDAVEKKLADVKQLVEEFNHGKTSGEAQKLQTKITHILGRLDYMEPVEDTDQKKKSELFALALTLMGDFNDKVEEFERKQSQVVPTRLALLESQIGASTFQEGLHNASQSSVLDGTVQRRMEATSGAFNKTIPPHKWDLKKFAGDGRSLSINAFFERVEELCLARNVTKEALLDAGIDLFADKAYQFYKDCRARVNSWEELVKEFKEEYLSANHNEAVFEELRRRTQHPSETIGVYLAVMSSYFNRLGCHVSEGVKLSIVMKNLHPFYQDRLRDPVPTTMEELRTVCRRMEARRDVMNSYVEPSSKRGQVLEEDLAFLVVEELDSLQLTSKPSTDVSREIVCYRCKQPGHRAIGCALPQRKHCFKCKKDGVTVRTCPTCSKQGNETRRT